MKTNLKVTLLMILLFVFVMNNRSHAQEIIPIKSDDGWSYQNTSNGKTVYSNLDKAEPFRSGVGIAQKKGKWGALSTSMEILIPFDYETMEMIQPEVICGYKDRMFDLYNLSGETIKTGLTSALDSEIIPDALVVSDSKRRYGLISSTGKTIIPLEHARAPKVVNESYFLFYKAKKKDFYQGVYSRTGDLIVPFNYAFVVPHGSEHYFGQTKKEKYHFYNKQGERVFESDSYRVQFVDSSYIVERNDDDVQLTVLSTGKKFKHETVQQFNQMMFGKDSIETRAYFPDGRTFTRNGAWTVKEIRDDLLLVWKSENRQTLYGLWDLNGKEVLSANHGRVFAWSKKWAVVNSSEVRNKQVLIDLEGQKVVGDYDRVELLSCDNLKVLQDGVTTILNKELKELSEDDVNKKSVYYTLSDKDLETVRRKYTYATKSDFDGPFEDGEDCGGRDIKEANITYIRLIEDAYARNPVPNRLVVTILEDNKRKSGILNFEGKVIVPFEYVSIGRHMNGLIQFGESEQLDIGSKVRIGLMTVDGEHVLPARYDEIQDLRGDTAIVALHGVSSLINIRTNEVILTGYRGIRYYNKHYSLDKNGKRGLADETGKVVVPVIYDNAYLDSENLYIVERKKKKFYLDQNGNEIPVE